MNEQNAQKSELSMLGEDVNVLVIQYVNDGVVKRLHVLGVSSPTIFDFSGRFITFDKFFAIETYIKREVMSPHSFTDSHSFAVLPHFFMIPTDSIHRVTFFTKEDAEYPKLREFLNKLYAERIKIALPSKQIKIVG